MRAPERGRAARRHRVRDVDVGVAPQRWQRVHPGEQFGGGGHEARTTAEAGSRAAADGADLHGGEAEPSGGAVALRAGGIGVGGPRPGVDAVEGRGDEVVVVQFRSRQQLAVEGRAGEQLGVGALGHDLALVEHDDAVGQAEGRVAMGDEHRGAGAEDVLEGAVDGLLGAGVDGRGGVVEDEHRGVGERGTRQCDSLALATGEREALLADLGVVPVGELEDELVRLGRAGGGFDLGGGRPGSSEGDVLPDGGREEEALLEHDVDGAPQRVEAQVAHVLAVEADGAGARVVEARHEEGEGGLARAGGPDDAESLAGSHGQRDVPQHRCGVAVAEAHVLEAHRALGVDHLARVGSVVDPRLHVEDLEDPLGAGSGLLGGGEHARHEPDGRDELDEEAGERQEDAGRDAAPQREPPAEREHGELAEHGHGLEGRGVASVEASGPHARPVELPSLVDQQSELPVLLPERLHDPHTGHGLVHDGGDLSGHPLVVPAGREDAVAEAHGHPREHGDEHQHHDAQQRGEHGHHGDRHDHQGEVGDQHRHRVEEHLDERQVGGGTRHHVADRELVVTGEVELVEVPVHREAQVVLDSDAHLGGQVAPTEVAEEAEGTGQDEQRHHRGQRSVAVDDAVVEDLLLDEREEADQRLGHDR